MLLFNVLYKIDNVREGGHKIMKIIKEHIKNGVFKPFYLLYGSEDYLKRLYRDKLKAAILGDLNEMNYSYYEGKDIDVKAISEIAQTLPFFSDRRLIVIENSGLFKSQSELADHILDIPDSTFFLFIEEDVDKRNKLYKFVLSKGCISQMDSLDEKNTKLFIVSLINKEGKRITEDTVTYLLDKTGTDMVNIINEVDKLIGYLGNRDIITTEDVDAIITPVITSRIFAMIDAIGSKQQDKALALYYDLLSLREKPLSILFLIVRHYNILLQVKDMHNNGMDFSTISKNAGIPPFAVNKYIAQTRSYSQAKLMEAIEFALDIEEQVKTGRMIDKIGVEVLIISFSS